MPLPGDMPGSWRQGCGDLGVDAATKAWEIATAVVGVWEVIKIMLKA